MDRISVDRWDWAGNRLDLCSYKGKAVNMVEMQSGRFGDGIMRKFSSESFYFLTEIRTKLVIL